MAQPNTFKQKNVFVSFSPTFNRQAAIGTALASAVLTARLPLPRENKPLPTRRLTREETRECSGKYLIGRRITSRLTLWTIQLDATAELVTGFLALALGVAAEPSGSAPATHEITRSLSDQLPATTFIIGAEDSDEPAELYRDMILNTLDITAEVRGKVSLSASFIGSADVDTVADYDPPACANIVPVYANDCALLINAVNYTEALRSFAYRYNNNLLSGDDPFPFDAIDLVRLERGDETSLFQFSVYGTKASALYTLAEAETVVPIDLRIGTANEGARIISAGAQLTLQDTPVGYAGEANRSVINLDATPFSVSGGLPDRVSSRLAADDRFLTVPA